MDFLALPRRDLQALCKRNGVRANMTSAAMADALRALPKVDGIEEYVKQPVPVPGPEEKDVGKQANPLPRGRRAAAKSSEPIEPAEEDNEEEKLNAKPQSSKEGAPALGVERRGASQRARLVPVVPQLAAMAEGALKREAKRGSAPAPVLGRRGTSRRARPSPAVAAPAAEPELAGAEEEQREEKVEATMDDVPALGVGRRGARRRARPAPSVAALANKVVAEEDQMAPIPRGRRVNGKGSSAEPIRLDDSDDEVKEMIIGVGRRGGAGWRAQAALAVAAPEAKAQEEQRAPVPRGGCVKTKSTKLVRLDQSKEVEKQEETKPEEENGGAPAIAVERCGASRRTPAPSEAPATRRSSAASKAEAGDVAVEAVPIRATRQLKPTMKAAAAAAAQEKAPRRAARRGAVMSTLLQQEVQEQSQEVVGASDVATEVVPIRTTRLRKPTMKAAAEKAPPRATRRGTVMRTVLQPEAQEEQQEAVDAPVCYQQCGALKELEEAFDAQNEELNKVNAPKQDEDQDLVIIEDEKLMEETLEEEPFVTNQECTEKSKMQEQLVDDEKCYAPLAIHEESPILDPVSMITKEASEDDEVAVDAPVSHQRCVVLEELAEAYDPRKEEFNNVDTQKQDEDQDVVISEDEKRMEATPAEESSVTHQAQEEPEEAVGVQVSYQKCDALEELEEACDPQKEELHKVDRPKQDEDQDLVVIEDEKLMEEIPVEEPSLTDQECMDQSEMQEQLFDDEKCHAPLVMHKESPILGLVSTVTEQAYEDDAEAVGATVSYQRHDDLEQVVEVSDPQKEELNEVDEPKQDEDQYVGMIGDEKVMEETAEEESSVTDQAQQDPKAAVGALVSYQQSDALEELAEASEPQKEELNEVDTPKHDEDQDVIIIENEKLMEETKAEEPSVTDQERADNSEMQEQQVDNEKCHALLSTQQESLILGLVSTVTEQASEGDVGDTYDAGEEIEFLPGIQTLQAPFTCNESDANNESEMGNFNEVPTLKEEISEVDAQEVSKEKEHTDIAELLSDIVDETAFLDCSSNISMVAVEEINEKVNTAGVQTNEEVNTKDGLDGQEEGDVVVDKVLHDCDNTILLDCSSDISWVEMEKAGNVTSEMSENGATLDEDGQEEGDVEKAGNVTSEMSENGTTDFGHGIEQKKASTVDTAPEILRAEDSSARKEIALLDDVLLHDVRESLSKSIMTMEPSVCKNSSRKRKNSVEPMAVLQEKGVKVASECEDLTKLSLGQLRAKLKEKLITKKNKEAKKRVALARVDENVCRSHAKGQQQDLKS